MYLSSGRQPLKNPKNIGSLPHGERYADSEIAGGIWGEGPDAMHQFSAWTDDKCMDAGGEVFGLNRTGDDKGFCLVLDDSTRWQEWKCVRTYI